MNDQVGSDLATLALSFAVYCVLALVVVLAMRTRGPVWASRAAHASLIVLVLSFVPFSFRSTGASREFVEVGPATLMIQCAAVVVATALGSRLSRLPSKGDVRQASIAPRRLFVARVPHQRRAALLSAGVAFAAMAAAALMATGGTTLVRTHDGARGVANGFPGWPSMLPAGVSGVVLALCAWWALREVRDRPRIADPLDTQLRARDASRVVRATAFGFAVAASTVLFSVGAHMNEVTQRLRSLSETAPRSPWDAYQWLAFGLYVPAIVLLFVALGALSGSVGSREELEQVELRAAGPSPSPSAGPSPTVAARLGRTTRVGS